MVESALCKERRVEMYRDGKMEMVNDILVVEQPLTIIYNDVEVATLVCSPEALRELGVGFLVSEGLLHGWADITELSCNEAAGLLRVSSKSAVIPKDSTTVRHVNTCNGKGQAGLQFVNEIEPVPLRPTIIPSTAPQLLHLISLLEEKSVIFRRTGGVHSAALADRHGFLARYEDVGRHNAVDKSLGYALLNQIDPSDKILVLSGRIASEILLKAARSRIPMVLSRSAPTFLAVELADKLGITIVGFARGEQLNVYSYMERVAPQANA